MNDSRLPGFFKKRIAERLETLVEQGFVRPQDAVSLKKTNGPLSVDIADKMAENVVSVFGLPFAIAPNFLVNGRDFVVPMVVEEPSVVAGVSGAARLMRKAGGFVAQTDDPVLLGQIQLLDVGDPDKAIEALQASEKKILKVANDLQPNLAKRGGGARSIAFRKLDLPDGSPTIMAHIAVDTQDAMGANLVNSICEGIAPSLAEISGATAGLRILSNLADQALVTSEVTIPLASLRVTGFAAAAVRDGIVAANNLALVDRYRAATHNKGIMNGIDALAIATGNDWRAIEAGAHTFACRDGHYRALTHWTVALSGDLHGELTMPLKVGIVGGSLKANPAARIGLQIVAAESASELAQLMCSVGLAQNFAALRALVTNGIQKGHMSLHARSVASAAGAPAEIFDQVVRQLIESGEVKQRQAREIIDGIQQSNPPVDSSLAGDQEQASGTACGKVILLGEHAVVYGRHALAIPIRDAMTATCRAAGSGISLRIPAWNINQEFEQSDSLLPGAAGILQTLLQHMNVRVDGLDVAVTSRLPMAMGLGSSAALAAAMARAINQFSQLTLADDEIDRLTFECEKIAHGQPSGIDNTIAVYGQPVLFGRNDSPVMAPLDLEQIPPLVIACSGTRGMTRVQVDGVRTRYDQSPSLYDAVFDEIDKLSIAGATALKTADYDELGAYMNVCHGLLNAIEVSTPELEAMVSLARQHGALGAKLTGAGGGGSIVALCPGISEEVSAALQSAGYQTIELDNS